MVASILDRGRDRLLIRYTIIVDEIGEFGATGPHSCRLQPPRGDMRVDLCALHIGYPCCQRVAFGLGVAQPAAVLRGLAVGRFVGFGFSDLLGIYGATGVLGRLDGIAWLSLIAASLSFFLDGAVARPRIA